LHSNFEVAKADEFAKAWFFVAAQLCVQLYYQVSSQGNLQAAA
jgi:hypothetical protein